MSIHRCVQRSPTLCNRRRCSRSRPCPQSRARRQNRRPKFSPVNPTSFDALIPSVVYTDPEIAWVGLTETDAREQNRKIDVVRFPWAALGQSACHWARRRPDQAHRRSPIPSAYSAWASWDQTRATSSPKARSPLKWLPWPKTLPTPFTPTPRLPNPSAIASEIHPRLRDRCVHAKKIANRPYKSPYCTCNRLNSAFNSATRSAYASSPYTFRNSLGSSCKSNNSQ